MVTPVPALTAGILAGVLAFAAGAAAQVQERPAREGGAGVFGGGQAPAPAPTSTRTQQSLSLTVSALGSYDDRSRAEQQPGLEPQLEPLSQDSSGFVDASLRYRLGNVRHWFTANGAAFLTAYEAERALAGGELRASGMTSLGRRNRVDVSQAYRDAPFMTLAGFGDLVLMAPDVLPDSDPTLAVHRQPSRTATTTASFAREWTTRQSTSFGYGFSRTDYPQDSLGFDTRSHSLNLQHTWQVRRSIGLLAGYDRSRSRYVGHAGHSPMTQSATVGVDYVRRLSRTRQIAFGGDAGAAQVEVITSDSDEVRRRWTPSGGGHVRVDIGRSWAVTADYSRSATVLHQAALQTFYSDAMVVNTGGLIGRRLDVTVTGSFARGRAPGATTDLGRYETRTAAAQLRWALSRSVATMIAYTFHDYRIRNVTVLEGFPVQSRLSGLRVGVSYWTPLFGERRAAAPTR